MLGYSILLPDYDSCDMPTPGRQYATDQGYRYGFNGQEKDDEVAGEGNSNTAMYWQYDTRLGRRWNQDPKPNPSISNYACFANNPVIYTDLLGDTVKFGGLIDRINTGLARIFNKNFRNEFRENKKSQDVWIYDKNRDLGEHNLIGSGIYESKPKSANGIDYDEHMIYYKKGIGIGDIDNGIIRNVAAGVKTLGQITWSGIKLPLSVVVGMPTVAFRKWALGQDVGWGVSAFAWMETPYETGDYNVFSFGFGNWDKYNMFGGEIDFGNNRGYDFRALIGLRIGSRGNRPPNFIDVFGEIQGFRHKYHALINLVGKKKRRKDLNREEVISFHTKTGRK